MLKTSAIRHPEASCFVRRHDWQVTALGQYQMGNGKRTEVPQTGAEILCILEYHYNNRFANRILRQLIEYANQKKTTPLREIGDWMPYSVAYFEELLLQGRGPVIIGTALKALDEIGFISSNVPPDIPKFYSKNMHWYKLNVDFINGWIDENVAKTWLEPKKTSQMSRLFGPQADDIELPNPYGMTGKPKDEEPVQPDPDGDTPISKVDPLKGQYAQVTALCDFHRHVHGKTSRFIYDNNRRGNVAKILKQKGRTLAQAAQAILGNLCSDWHQGRDKNNLIEDGGKVYDDIELIFRNAKMFENHLAYAENRKITPEVAWNEFSGFLDGKPSRYAKKQVKAASEAANEQTEADDSKPKLSDLDAYRYREFSRKVAAFFVSSVTNANILEMCSGLAELKTAGKGLVDTDYLAEAIVDAVKIFRINGIESDVIDQINQFAKTFTKLQQLNK